MKVWEEIYRQLTKAELLELLRFYNEYVIEILDREDGSIPVCLPEYYQNEFQDIINERCNFCGVYTEEEYYICQTCDQIFCESCYNLEKECCKKCEG